MVLAPAEVTAGATAADTGYTVDLVAFDLLVSVLAVVLPESCLAFGGSRIENQQAYIGPAGVEPGLADLVVGLKVNNKIAVVSHSEEELDSVEAQVQVVAGVLFGGAEQVPTVGYEFRASYQFSWDQRHVVKLFRQIENGLTKRALSAQAEAWPILSESRQVLVCLLGSGWTYELLEDVSPKI